MVFGTTRRRRLLLPCMVLGLLLVILSQRRLMHRKLRHKAKLLAIQSMQMIPDKALVIAKSRHESIDWALDLSPSWHPYIYTTSNPPQPYYLTLPSPHGSEATAYLTFINTHYDSLPNVTAFVPAQPPASTLLPALHLQTVATKGYATLHCAPNPAPPCPSKPTFNNAKEPDPPPLSQLLSTLHNVSTPTPPVPRTPFIVTKQQIRSRSREDYGQLLEWATARGADAEEAVQWAFEHAWAAIFGAAPGHCVPVEQCRCELFGWCEAGEEQDVQRTADMKHYVPLVRGAHPSLGRWFAKWVGG